MSQAGIPSGNTLSAAMPGLTRAGVVMLAILLAGLVSMSVLSRQFKVVFTKPPAPLPHGSLAALPRAIGPYTTTVPGEPERPDRQLNEEVVRVLGTTDYLLREYRDTRKPRNELGATVAVNLNYYPSGSATPHVPDVCWVGNGMKRFATPHEFLDVKGVTRRDGSKADIRMRLLGFVPLASDPEDVASLSGSTERLVNVAYVFQVNGRYAATATEVSRDFWDPQAKYAYHTKIELTLVDSLGRPMPCTPAEAEPIFEEFLRQTLATIEEYLPDPERLAAMEGAGSATQPASDGGAGRGTQEAQPSFSAGAPSAVPADKTVQAPKDQR